MKKKILIAIILIVVVVVGYIIYKPINVQLTDVSSREFVKETVLTGKVMFTNQSSVKSKISGDILQVYVSNGQQVEKGDVLFTIDSSQYYHNYQVVLKDVEKARNALDQYIDTNRDNLNDPEIVHGRQVLEIALQQAKSKQIANSIGFNDYKIVAPISGRFYFTNLKEINVGDYITLNTEVGKIYNNQKLKAKIGVTPDELSSLDGVSKVKAQIEGYDKRVTAEIDKISDAVSKNENGDDVVFVTFNIIDDVNEIYRKDGLDVKLYIEKPAGKMLGVPFSAVFSEQSEDYVYIVNNNKAVKTQVTIIDDFGDYLAVKNNNIKEGDKIVKVVVKGLKNGKRVKSK